MSKHKLLSVSKREIVMIPPSAQLRFLNNNKAHSMAAYFLAYSVSGVKGLPDEQMLSPRLTATDTTDNEIWGEIYVETVELDGFEDDGEEVITNVYNK